MVINFEGFRLLLFSVVFELFGNRFGALLGVCWAPGMLGPLGGLLAANTSFATLRFRPGGMREAIRRPTGNGV